MSVQDLRDVLRERAEGPSPANPLRHEQVRARVQRIRLRRRTAWTATAMAVVVAGLSQVPGAAGPAPRETTTAARLAGELPALFTAPDGTEYRRVAAARMAPAGPKRMTVEVPLTGRPLEAAVSCDNDVATSLLELIADGPEVLVNGKQARAVGGGCANGMSLQPLDVAQNGTKVAVTFDASEHDCYSSTPGGPCLSAAPRVTDWELAVYELTPPARAIEPGPLRALPQRVSGKDLADSRSGVWSQESPTPSFTLTGRSDAGVIAMNQICSGDLTARMWFKFRVNGKESPSSSSCPTWEEGPFPAWPQEFQVPPGEPVTVEVRMGLWGQSVNRPVRWSLGLYAK